VRVIARPKFYHDGRGPSLLQVHFAPRSAHLVAIDYSPPDWDGKTVGVRHLRFLKSQVHMFTPEEVENYSVSQVNWGATEKGALVSLGRTLWLNSFSPIHLGRCEHFRAMFYDEFLDVVCEDVSAHEGAYVSEGKVASGAA
jgi:hypothetical protein